MLHYTKSAFDFHNYTSDLTFVNEMFSFLQRFRMALSDRHWFDSTDYLEHPAGIEPASLAWKARTWPICQGCFMVLSIGFEPIVFDVISFGIEARADHPFRSRQHYYCLKNNTNI